MTDTELRREIDAAAHRGVAVGELTAVARTAARGTSTTAAVDALCDTLARHIRANGRPGVTAVRVRAAIEAA